MDTVLNTVTQSGVGVKIRIADRKHKKNKCGECECGVGFRCGLISFLGSNSPHFVENINPDEIKKSGMKKLKKNPENDKIPEDN